MSEASNPVVGRGKNEVQIFPPPYARLLGNSILAQKSEYGSRDLRFGQETKGRPTEKAVCVKFSPILRRRGYSAGRAPILLSGGRGESGSPTIRP